MKNLAIIGASYLQLPLIEKAKEMGVYVGVVDINAKAPAAALANEFYNYSILDLSKLIVN